MVKVRIVQATIGYYEVEVKRAWYLPWATVYDDACLGVDLPNRRKN